MGELFSKKNNNDNIHTINLSLLLITLIYNTKQAFYLSICVHLMFKIVPCSLSDQIKPFLKYLCDMTNFC